MASLLEHTVMPSGGNYTTLDACIDHLVAAHANLVTADVYAEVKIDGTWSSADTATVTIDGLTTDATHYLLAYTTAAARHAGKWSYSKYCIVVTSDWPMYILDNYVRLTGIQIKVNTAGVCLRTDNISDGSSLVIVDSCILWFNGTSGGDGVHAYAGTLKFRNCAIYGAGSGSGVIVDNYSTVNCLLENCSIGKFNTGMARSGGTAAAKNTYSGGNTTTDYSGTITYTTCASSDATSRTGVTPNIAYSVSAGAYLTNITVGSEDFHIGASSVLIGAGTDLSGIFTLDIDGDTRS